MAFAVAAVGRDGRVIISMLPITSNEVSRVKPSGLSLSLLTRIWLLLLKGLLVFSLAPLALAYDKAVEGPDVVLNKLFPKVKKVELNANAGVVLNSSYQQTFLLNAGLTYFPTEIWGFSADVYFALASDKSERDCIETFYNDPNFVVGPECDTKEETRAFEQDPDGDANYGPAYVPIRTIKYMFVGDLNWNPIYGKQIVLLSATNYFDFFLNFGGGIAMSDFQPKTTEFPSTGTKTRGTFCIKKVRDKGECNSENPGTTDDALVGKGGRPAVESQTNPLIHLAVGQRFHFLKVFHLNGSLDNFTLLGGPSGFENFSVIKFGGGVRF